MFAKTMPRTPHEYTLRVWAPYEPDFTRFGLLIEAHGRPEWFFGKPIKSGVLYLDGLKYWTAGKPAATTCCINRADDSLFYGPQR